MREIQAELLTSTVAQMCIRANYDLPRDVLRQLQSAQAAEPWPAAQEILRQILENAELAAANAQPICQDTGMACVFLEIGQEVHIAGDLKAAVQEGVRRGYASPSCATRLTASTRAIIPRPCSILTLSPANRSKSPSLPRASAAKT